MQQQEIRLDKIVISGNNPRKTFDPDSMLELSKSVQTHGVIQPILVRPLPLGGYELVAGERRYRAAHAAGLQEIPAVIRPMSDDEALEVMLLENFQRKDVHPLEEAWGFKALRAQCKMLVKDIAKRVGKSADYVADRLKLSGLIEELHEPFYKGKFNLTTAIEIAAMPDEVQQEWMESVKDWSHWTITSNAKVTKYLSQAPFDITDAKLIKHRGACTTCEHNTANSELFPDLAEEKARCLNKLCWNAKLEVGIRQAIAEAKKNDILIAAPYDPSKKLKQLLEGTNQHPYHSLSTIEYPDREDYFDEDLGESYKTCDKDYYETEDEWQRAWDRSQKNYDEALQEWQQLQDGDLNNYVKALLVNNDFSYSWIFAEPPKAASAKSQSNSSKPKVAEVADKAKSGEATLLETSQAIDAINVEIEGVKGLAKEKIYEAVQALARAESEEGISHEDTISFNGSTDFMTENRLMLYAELESGMREEVALYIIMKYPDTLSAFEVEDIGDFKLKYIEAEKVYSVAMDYIRDQEAFEDLFAHIRRCRIFEKIRFWAGLRGANTSEKATLFIEWIHSIPMFQDKVEEIQKTITAKYDKKLAKLTDQRALLQQTLDAAPKQPAKAKKSKK